jgi:hypothetical protein
MPLTVRYHFTQTFAVSAKSAFDWCTSFDSKDYLLMGEEGVERQITRVGDATIILKDIFPVFQKEKLVQLYPDQLSWISTHLSGPNKYSQFLYQITPKGKDASVLHFTALHLEYDAKAADAKTLADRLCREDAVAWTFLAEAMANELRK